LKKEIEKPAPEEPEETPALAPVEKEPQSIDDLF